MRLHVLTFSLSTSKLSLSMNPDRNDSKSDHPTRTFSSSKRFGGGDTSSHGRSNPFNTMSPLTTSAVASPTSASTAFGLGSGAFASFGSASKTPKTPGTAFDWSKTAGNTGSPATPVEKREKKLIGIVRGMDKDLSRDKAEETETPGKFTPDISASNVLPSFVGAIPSAGRQKDASIPWALKYSWIVWYRPPSSKNTDYEKSITPMCRMTTAQEFWKVYQHLKRPSTLPTVSDYHFFRESIRPVWEDDENKKGGKWILRLKKGVADRYWEDLLLGMIGDQFMEAGEEVCGAVVSVRPGEDVISVWTKNNGGRNVKIRYVPTITSLRRSTC